METDRRVDHRLAAGEVGDALVFGRRRADRDHRLQPRRPGALEHARQIAGQASVRQVGVAVDGGGRHDGSSKFEVQSERQRHSKNH